MAAGRAPHRDDRHRRDREGMEWRFPHAGRRGRGPEGGPSTGLGSTTRGAVRASGRRGSGAVYALDANTLEPVGKRYEAPIPLCSVDRGATRRHRRRHLLRQSTSIQLVDVVHGRLQHKAGDRVRPVVRRRLAGRPPACGLRRRRRAPHPRPGDDGVARAHGRSRRRRFRVLDRMVRGRRRRSRPEATRGRSRSGTARPERASARSRRARTGPPWPSRSWPEALRCWRSRPTARPTVDSDPRSWVKFACTVVARDLSPDEWRDALGDRPYQEGLHDVKASGSRDVRSRARGDVAVIGQRAAPAGRDGSVLKPQPRNAPRRIGPEDHRKAP